MFHTVVGVFLFSIVGGAAVFLHYLTSIIKKWGVDDYIIMAIQGLGFFIFSIDFLCLVVFILKEAWTFVRELMREFMWKAEEKK